MTFTLIPAVHRAVRSGACLALLLLGAATHAAPPVELRLIGINDFHGNLESTGLYLPFADPAAGADAKPLRVPVGGAAANAGLVKSLRAGAPHSLMLSAGDLIGASPLVSTLFRHESTIAVMNAIGLELDAVGNHEFDAGFAELKRVGQGGCAPQAEGSVVRSCAFEPYRGAHFPLLSSNVLDAAGRTVLAPYVVKRYAGIRVGIIGAVTKTAPTLVTPTGVAGLTFIDEADGVNRAARVLRAQGVKTIVAVFHEGGELGTASHRGDWNDPSCPDRHGPIFDIAERLSPEISVVFSAHTHQGYRCLIGGRTIISGTSFGRGISVVDVQLDRRTGRLLPARTRSINLPVLNDQTDRMDAGLRDRIAATLPPPYADVLRTARPDPAIAAMVAGYAAAVAPTVQRPVGTLLGNFPRSGDTDSPAGRLVADANFAATRAPERGGAQIALINPGSLRSDLECVGPPPCTVNFGQVFTMQPFGNTLVVMTLTGAQLKALLESQDKPDKPTFLQPSAGLAYAWQSDAAPGDKVRDLRIDGEPVTPDRAYRVAVNSFLADGGDGFVTLLEGRNRVVGGLDVDAMLDYLKAPAERAPVMAPRVRWLPEGEMHR